MTPDSPEDFRRLADEVPLFVWTQAPDGSIDWANRTWYDYVRLPREIATTPEGWARVVHPDDIGAVTAAFRGAAESRAPYEIEHRLKPADGDDSTYRWVLSRSVPRFDATGALLSWVGTGVDIHDSKLLSAKNADIDAERGARARERFFSRLGAELSGALSLEQTLRVVTRSVVPEFADWALVNLIDERGEVRLAAAFHRDTEKHEMLEAVRGESYANPSASTGVSQVIRTGRPVVYEVYSDEVRRDAVDASYHARLDRIGIDSALIVPLFSAGRVVGTLNAVHHGSGRAFSAADVPFFEELGRRIAPAIGNATAYERERRVATTFQEAALVPSLPDIPGLTFEAIYEAAMLEATVGGDWYDAFRLPDGRVVLSVGDVAGKGLQAAVAMASVRQSIRTAALINPEPEAVLNAVDRIVRAIGQAPFVTAFVGVLDPISFEFAFASAGHPPALLRDADGAVTLIGKGDLPLGLRGRCDEPARTIEIAPGSVLLCYTDGLTEFDRDPVAGERRVRDAFALAAHDVAREIYTDISQGRPPQDDVAILAVAFHESLVALDDPRRASVWSFDSSDAHDAGRTRREYTDRLRAVGLSDDEISSAELVFGELVGNVVRYAPGSITAILDVSGPAPVLHVLDDGRGFEFRPRLPIDVLSERGRGLFIVTAFAEELSVERRRGGGSHARAVLAGRTRHETTASSSRDVRV